MSTEYFSVNTLSKLERNTAYDSNEHSATSKADRDEN
jgi:hypothetical protein